MTAQIGTWVWVMPSGDVHYVVGGSGGMRRFACGAYHHRYTVSDRYPPSARRCVDCQDARDPEDEEVL